MVHGNQQEEPFVTETAAAASVIPASRRGKRLSGSLSQLILQAFESPTNSRKVLSLLAIKKFLTEVGYAVNKNSQRLKRELCSLVSHGLLVRVTGSGASGSFKLNSKTRGTGRSDPGKKKKAVTPKKPAADKREPQKKPRKKQPAVSKAKCPPSKTSVDQRKKQLKHPARPVAARKAARKRN
ncbi:histone H1-like [Tiliqua scincoides]|uniref:histone H1-like n=1 Tax=Tiliqua scincoides TaxID=71010 RepID=UPI0034637C56